MISIKNKKFFAIIIILNILAFFTTTYIFIIPAQSRTSQDALSCQIEEHIHTDECFAPYTENYSGKILICSITSENGSISHKHDLFCYDSNNNLICPIEEYVHTHNQSCFNENNKQICGITVHQHNEQCFSDTVNKEDYRMLVCSHEAHTHEDNCYELHAQEEIATSENIQTENYDVQPLNVEFESQEVYNAENTAQTDVFDTSGAIDMSEKNNDGSLKYIEHISVSYQKSDEWVHIENDGNNKNLPASADYRLEVSYKNIDIKELQEHHEGKLMLDNIPDWLEPDKNGEILLDSVPVASMQVQNSKLLITFHDDFMNSHSDKNLSGTFFVRGSVNWHKLNNDKGTIELPTINMTIEFEKNLPQKYGQMSISKSYPELIYSDSKEPYFKYVLTVKSLESDCSIPDVKVEDFFTKNETFIKGYYGIDETVKTLSNSKNGFEPFETKANDTAGSVVKNADSESICWNIGSLLPNEERSLTYYAKIDPYYIGSFGRGSITNTAEAFSGDISKGSDSSEFIPRAEAWINKKLNSSHIDENGTGTLTYQVEITAPSSNNYDLINLRLHDYVDEKFSRFVTYPKTITAVSDMPDVMVNCETNNPDNKSFNAVIPVLRPGEKVTVTYEVDVNDILLSGTGDIEFINTAELFSEESADRGDASNRRFGSSQNTHTFSQSQWVRKLDGGNITEDTKILINGGNAYTFNDSAISPTTPPSDFTVPAGDKKYQIVLNEKGKWDLSSAVMKDKLDNTNIVYNGWLCIQEFEKSGVTEQTADADILSTISGQTPSKTVWLNIDGRNEFSFVPSELGLSHNCTYLMTYYAGIKDASNAGTVIITNNFEVSGDVGIGGEIFYIPGIKVSVSSLIQGNVHYNVHKDDWYYSEYPDETGKVPIYHENDYEKGALYWVIKVDGDINAGFRIKDIVQGNGGNEHTVCGDSVAGIYKGSKSLDFTDRFHSYSEMLDNAGDGKELQALSGNEINLGHDPDNESLVYEQVYIDNISELDEKSLVIANFNKYPAVVSNEIVNADSNWGSGSVTGLKGNKDITTQNEDTIMSASELTQWNFQQVDGNKFYIYTDVNGEQKYMSISGDNGNGNVSLSVRPVELYISQNGAYPGKIKISISDDKGMALNWYGQNGYEEKFSGWNDNNETDINDFQTVLEVKNTDNNYDYKWFSQNANENLEICFQHDMELTDDEALYIVVRTAPSYKPAKDDDSGFYKNGVASKQNSSSATEWVHANTAEYILKTATAVFKEGISAYRFDGTKWIDYDSVKNEKHLDNLIESGLAIEPGTYAEWLINVNWDGSMEGLAEISDQLPDYLTPVYLCQHWIPDRIDTPDLRPTYPTIPEFESDDNWAKMQTSEIPFYYNPTTHELRWRVDNLQKETDPLLINKKTINMQLICKVNNPDILLSGKTKSIDNTVTVTNNGIVSKSTGAVNVSSECSLIKCYNGVINASGKTSYKQLDFTITVNQCKETLGNNNVLPPLVDEFSDNLAIIESSLKIESEDGNIISGYTYTLEDNKLIINKLPDKQKIIINYSARTKTIPDINNDIAVTNKAYWEGYEQPTDPQVSFSVSYNMGGTATLTGKPKVSIFKVDSENGAKHLEGAEFALYEQQNSTPVATGKTDKDGKLVFEVGYDTVYYITETKAPNGYNLSNEKYYFVIQKDREVTSFSNIPDIDIWESKIFGDEYKCTIRNSKEKILVKKTFTGENTAVSGKFSFGIFDKNPVDYPQIEPLQILEIEYVNGVPQQYKLDGITKDKPEFTIAEPNQVYYVFELNNLQKPVLNNQYLSTDSNLFEVEYNSELNNCNEVTISRNVISIENKVTYITMPNSGGIGLRKYYLIAGLFTVTAVLIVLKIKRKSLI